MLPLAERLRPQSLDTFVGQRHLLADGAVLRSMIEKDALAWAVGVVTAEEIDKINILNASILAMHRG